MGSNLSRQGGNIAEIIIIVLILVAVNWLGYYKFFRIDVTETKQYTISQSTKSLLAGLDDPVHVRFYMSRELPPELLIMRDEVKAMMDEYRVYGGANFDLRYIDPRDDEEKKQEAMGLGVQEVEFQIIKKDQVSVTKAFFGLVMNYEDKSEVIPLLLRPTTLEYEVTSRLLKLTMESKPRVGFFEGTFTTSQQQQAPSYQGIKQVLGGAEGLCEMVDIAGGDQQLPDDLDGLIICGAFGMSEDLKYSVDQYLLGGGQVLVALDPMMRAGQQGGLEQAFPMLPTIEAQLESYGVQFNKKLIVDPMSAMATFGTGFIRVSMPYWLWPQVGPAGFNKDIAPVGLLESVVMPWTAPLIAMDVPGVTIKYLMKTSEESFLMSSPFDLDPQQDWQFKRETSEGVGANVVAYLVEGEIPTAYSDGPPEPATPPSEEDGEDPEPVELLFDPGDHLSKSLGGGRLVVMSSTSALSDNFLQQFNQNVLYIQNIVDMLVFGEDLISIRSKSVTSRPLVQLTDNQRSFYRWMNILGVPVLLTLFGLLLWFLKGKRRQAIQRRYSG
ncbi:GldG family protein [bacterium]|nr:GldG family protein [bacterium]